MIVDSEDIIIIKGLMETGTLDLYSIHQRFLLSPAQIVRSLQRLHSIGILEYDAEKAKITEFGESWIIANRKELFLKQKKRYWALVKDSYRFPDYLSKDSPIVKYKDIIAIKEDGE